MKALHVQFLKNITAKSLKLEISKTERRVEQLLDRIVEAESSSVVSTYEKRIGQLQLDKELMREKSPNVVAPSETLMKVFELQ